MTCVKLPSGQQCWMTPAHYLYSFSAVVTVVKLCNDLPRHSDLERRRSGVKWACSIVLGAFLSGQTMQGNPGYDWKKFRYDRLLNNVDTLHHSSSCMQQLHILPKRLWCSLIWYWIQINSRARCEQAAWHTNDKNQHHLIKIKIGCDWSRRCGCIQLWWFNCILCSCVSPVHQSCLANLCVRQIAFPPQTKWNYSLQMNHTHEKHLCFPTSRYCMMLIYLKWFFFY